MNVKHHDQGTFFVTGSSGRKYFVDLLAYKGNGKCDCWPFTKDIEPKIKQAIEDGTFDPRPEFECPHIVAANRKLLHMFKDDLLKRFPDQDE